MQVPVVVQMESEGHYTAELLGKSDLRVEGASEAEALRKLAAAIGRWLESVKLVRLDVPLRAEATPNPWLDSCGRSAADPDFEDFVGELERARRPGELE